MDIAAASAIQQAQTAQLISTAVAKKSLDAQKQEGAGALALLQAAVDSTAQQQPVAAGRLDVTA